MVTQFMIKLFHPTIDGVGHDVGGGVQEALQVGHPGAVVECLAFVVDKFLTAHRRSFFVSGD